MQHPEKPSQVERLDDHQQTSAAENGRFFKKAPAAGL